MADPEFHPIYDELLKRPACVRFHPGQLPLHEYERAARMNHPNILAIFEVRQKDLITEAVEGTRLSDFLNISGDRRAFTRQFQRMLIEPLLSALSYAHQHGVVHGFLHPGNIWLFPRDQLKVWGFNFTGLEAERSARGWDFAAPEVRRGQRAGVRSDVWSVGAVLHFLYCGQLPSQSKQDSVPEVVYRCLAEDPARRYSGIYALQAEFSQESESVMDGAEEAMLHTTLGNNYFRQFRVELAVLEWEKALAIQPDYPVALNNLGVAYWHWGRLREATDCFRRAKSLLNLGLILLQQGDLPAAREALNKSIIIQPKHSQAYLALGECLLGLGKIPAGIEELHKALILNPQSARALRGLAGAYDRLGRTEEAVSYREKSLELVDQQLEFQPLILETPLGESTR